jgi:hypothetical protein
MLSGYMTLTEKKRRFQSPRVRFISLLFFGRYVGWKVGDEIRGTLF